MADYLAVSMADDDIKNISALGLAHVGDAVYELMVRTWLCASGRATAKGLHKAAITYVSAPAQARGVQKLLPVLTEEEHAVFRRGRNTRVNSVPRNATLEEYHASTGFETLFGYLWLKNRADRLNELFEIIIGPPTRPTEV
ncbi:ribonuclease-3 family protein [Sporobacter termitidis DSM 10068]|uniref:Mini-ribonuclease 3 n=1 Tax=Sporobacter termitidis DSM 10068 TaxID=1123282 RepID=A0A1M5X0F5_9FIRM|nr:ribonuclease III domain-containing protein [Sporobacter termitidis]SHH93008.1 ribonuclease-3 family protein [Sporobacter termitidis DSM 10068]